MPPSTRGSVGFSAAIACAGQHRHLGEQSSSPGSISESQCDLLFGSFQIIAASIMPALGLPLRAG